MNKQEAEKLIETIKSFVIEFDRPHQKMNQAQKDEMARIEAAGQKANGKALTLDRQVLEGTDNVGGHLKPFVLPELEQLYRQFKNRLIEECAIDPTLLHLLTTRPELVVEVERKELTLDGSTLRGRVARLIAGGWFDETRATAATRKELARTGSDPSGNNNLATALSQYRIDGFLVSEGDGWKRAPGIKVTETTIASR